ncbi:Tannase/feruloyl esterase [Penicillium macrosclerotiorum]|uniref:Tannase/feruloyl esterase n=1 Tax=Penicillium macrosclerotiorum TaxID=303699 RepID=UPI002548D31E|nr:Tannase/feruloyl esterase [Penicillium macrosclerotiorum]KAJ5679291.1 Tannase/feruloyl esterase [Penicillium macrosclerotiorum]
MRSTLQACAAALAYAAATTATSSLSDICQVSYAKKALPIGIIDGITIDASSVSTKMVTNYTASSIWFPTATFDYCNLTFAYSHDGIEDDVVHVQYWLPAPSAFKNRYVSTGGGGWAINSGSSSIPTGIVAGGVGGLTDGGFGNFNTQFSSVSLLANGTINWQATYMFGYQAHNELAILGKQLTRNIYNFASSKKLYSYYQGCSEGGREGWSQVQRFPDQFDGVVAGAPAFRWAQQQVNHLTGNVIQKNLNYFPSSCELEKVMNLTIESCDPLDGKTDGVVSRSDLCLEHLDWSKIEGASYTCAAAAGSYGSAATPAQTGKVSSKAVELIKTYWNGLHDSDGQRVYFTYQPGSTFTDLETEYDSTTGSWELDISGLGGIWVAQFIDYIKDAQNIDSLTDVTYDTLKEWMIFSQKKYGDILQTTYPDLTDFQAAGGKVLHIHGEQDYSIPTASSVRYWDSVRSIMFPDKSYNAGTAALDDFYRLFLIPGVGHCSTNSYQPNAVWPQTTLQTVIDWVENGKAPSTLAGSGDDIKSMCKWPLRPQWTNNGKTFECVFSQKSIDSFTYDLNAYKLPVY